MHWARFPAFRHVRGGLEKPHLTMKDADRGAVFMRWKEKFLVPDHRVQDISGASFAGEIYMHYIRIRSYSPSKKFCCFVQHFKLSVPLTRCVFVIVQGSTTSASTSTRQRRQPAATTCPPHPKIYPRACPRPRHRYIPSPNSHRRA